MQDRIVDTITVYSLPGFREPVNCFTHLIAAVVFLGLSARLVRRGQGHSGRAAALAIFGFTSVFLLSMSSVYHMLWPGNGRAVMERLDVAAIFRPHRRHLHARLCDFVSRTRPLPAALADLGRGDSGDYVSDPLLRVLLGLGGHGSVFGLWLDWGHLRPGSLEAVFV